MKNKMVEMGEKEGSNSESKTGRPAKGKLAKKTKFEVSYREGRPGKKCALCTYYHRGSCEVVQGSIDPGGICNDYKIKGEKPPGT